MDRRTELLTSAYEIIGREGIEGLHARAIAAALNLNHATVHYYFPTRSDLLCALVDYAEERFLKDREKVISQATEPVQRLEAEIALYEAYCRPQSRFFRVWTAMFTASHTNEKLRERLQRLSNTFVQRFAENKNLASYSRTLSQGPLSDPYVFISTMLGLGLMAQLHNNRDETSEKIDAIVSTMMGSPVE